MANPLTPSLGSAPPVVLPPHDSRKPSHLRIVMVTVAAVALLVSLAICFSVWAARAAITKVEARWHDLYPEYGPSPNKTDTHGSPKDVFPFPGLIGGGNPKAHSAGFQAPLFLPIFFVLGWSFLLCYAVGAALP
ncbi:MAG TPA: hypothetical protein VMH80_20660 [Bryobacteraceae bacterium]|nr:hypothetical protein [Bryobacteraceae bacterium]